MHGDGNGLYLRVTGSGSRSWMQQIVIHGRRRDLGLGGYPTIGLAQARALALANKALVTAGRDPLAERNRANVPTFREAAKKVYEANLPRWRSGKHTVHWCDRWSATHSPSSAMRESTASVAATCWPCWSRYGPHGRKQPVASGNEFAQFSDGARRTTTAPATRQEKR